MVRMATRKAERAGRTPRRQSAARPRAERQAQRREAILSAALDEFAARGFAATRLDDVARRAGVAKGTIYLYFRDKESLFQDLVRSVIGPLLARFEAPAEIDIPARVIAERVVDMFVRE